jgi:hypothetical protein
LFSQRLSIADTSCVGTLLTRNTVISWTPSAYFSGKRILQKAVCVCVCVCVCARVCVCVCVLLIHIKAYSKMLVCHISHSTSQRI